MSSNRALIEAHLQKAHIRLTRAERDYEEGFYEDSIIRAYYAIYHATKACLALKGSYPRTHKGVVSEFGQLYVTTGDVDAEYGKILSAAKMLREKGEYEAFTTIGRKVAKQKLNDAKAFLSMIEEVVKAGLR